MEQGAADALNENYETISTAIGKAVEENRSMGVLNSRNVVIGGATELDMIPPELQAALQLYQEAETLLYDTKKGEGNFWTFGKEIARHSKNKLRDLATFGVSTIIDSSVQANVLKKIAEAGAYEAPEKVLSENEMILYDAIITELAVELVRKDNRSYGAMAGQMTAEMIPFVRDIAVGKGLFGGLSAAAEKGLMRGIVKSIGTNKFGKLLVNLGRTGINFAESAVMASISPATIQKALQNEAKIDQSTLQLTDTGWKITKIDTKGKGLAYWEAVKEQVPEYFTETGGVTQFAANIVKSSRFGKFVAGSTFGQLAKALDNTYTGKFLNQTAYNGVWQEWGEELENTFYQAIKAAHNAEDGKGMEAFKNTYGEFFSPETQVPMLLSFSLPAILGGTVGTAQTIAINKKYDKAYEQIMNRFELLGFESKEEREDLLNNVLAKVYNADVVTNAGEGRALRDYPKAIRETAMEIIDSKYGKEPSQRAQDSYAMLLADLSEYIYADQNLSAIQTAHAKKQRQVQGLVREIEATEQHIAQDTHTDGMMYHVEVDGMSGYLVRGKLSFKQYEGDAFGRGTGTEIVTVRMQDGSVKQVAADQIKLLEQPQAAENVATIERRRMTAKMNNLDRFKVGDVVYLTENGQPIDGNSSRVLNITNEGIEVGIVDPNGQPNTTVIPHEVAENSMSTIADLLLQDAGKPYKVLITNDNTGDPIVLQEKQPGVWTDVSLAAQGKNITYTQKQVNEIIATGEFKVSEGDAFYKGDTLGEATLPTDEVANGNGVVTEETGEIFVSELQRRFGIGYNQATDIINQLVSDGIVEQAGTSNYGRPIYKVVAGKENELNERLTVTASIEQPTEQPQAEQPAKPYATDEQGNPAWAELDVEQSVGALLSEMEDDKELSKQFANSQIASAKAALNKANKRKPQATNDLAAFKAEAQAIKQEQAAAQEELSKWENVLLGIANYKTAEEQAEADAAAQRAAEQRAQRKQTIEGVGGTNMAERLAASPRIDGNSGSITAADGTKIAGHYVLVSANALTPSHNPNATFAPSEGYPTVDGQSINDRDYQADQEEQAKVQQVAQTYDGRAITNMPVVSDEGLVYSGNGRTMAGQLAAANGTDGAYTEALKENATQFGFTPEQVDEVPNARVVFMTDERLPYNTSTLALFNMTEQQTQSNTAAAAANVRKLTPEAVGHIIAAVQEFDNLDAFFSNNKAPFELVNQLIADGIISERDKAAFVDNGLLTATGKDRLTALLFGTAFDEKTIRLLGSNAKVRNSVMRALPQILENKGLGDFSLFEHINNAIQAIYDMDTNKMSFFEFTRQIDIEGKTASDKYSAFELLLSKAMVDGGVQSFRDILDTYNTAAKASVGGQMDLFTGEVMTIEQLTKQIVEEYGKEQETSAGAQPQPAVSGVQEGNGEKITDTVASEIIEQITAEAEEFEDIELTPSNWVKLFGEDGIVNTPKGKVKMGEGQFLKLMQKGRDTKLGMIKPTLERPSIIIEDKSKAKEGQKTEREYSYVFVKAFTGKNGERMYYFTSVTVQKDNQEVVVSNQEKERSRIMRLLKEGKLAYINQATLPSDTDTSAQGDQLTNPVGGVSADKGTKNVPNTQEKTAKNVVKQQNSGKNLIQGTDMTADEVVDIVKAGVADILEEQELSEDVEVISIEVIGSRSRGEAKEDSDLDILLYYKGDIKEDTMFNALNPNDITINGISVDINPIHDQESGDPKKWHKRDDAWREQDRETTERTPREEPVQKSVDLGEKASSETKKTQAKTEKVQGPAQKTAQFGQKTVENNGKAQELNDFAEKLGAKGLHIIESKEDLPKSEGAAYRALKNGAKVMGWYNPKTNQAYIYAPNANNTQEVYLTLLHEFVAHKGLRDLLGAENYDTLCTKVWNMMSEQDKLAYAVYAKTQIAIGSKKMQDTIDKLTDEQKNDWLYDTKVQLEAADEYMAHFAETGVSEQERTVWQKICDWVREALRKMGINVRLKNADIARLLYESSRRVSDYMTMREVAERISKNNEVYSNLANLNLDEKDISNTNDVRYRIGTQVVPMDDKTLVGLHNISASKLRKAIKQGGLANPSVAVINMSIQDHEQYGEVSLVMPSSMIDSTTGRNAGTYTGDIWSPTYPYVERKMSSKGSDKYYDALNKAFEGKHSGVKSRTAVIFVNMLDNQGNPDNLAYWYMLEKGIAPTDVIINSGISDDIKQRFEPLRDKRFVGDLTTEGRELLLGIAAELEGKTTEELLQAAQEAKKRYEDTVLANEKASQFSKRIAIKAIDEIDTYGVRFNLLTETMRKVREAIEQDGQVDVNATIAAAAKYVQENGLKDDFDAWLDNLDDRFDIEEVIFDGYTRDGDRKYVKNTIANASRLMNQQPIQNATSHGGLSATRGQLVERMSTLAQIRANKHRLAQIDEYEDEQWKAMQDEWFNNIINPLSNMQEVDDNPFINTDIAEQRLLEAIMAKDPIAYLNREYNYNIAADSKFAKALKDLMGRLKALPSKYFETKFKRPVMLNEFVSAVVPQDLPQDLKESLKEAGLDVYEYNEAEEGSRREATLQATEADGVRFRVGYDPMKDKTLNRTAAREMAEIKANAERKGTYLKAPNGADTKLTPRQWLQVRTQAFKEWFGDWELGFVKKFLFESSPVAELSGNEFAKVNGKTLTEQVAEYFNSIGGVAFSPLYGDVILDKSGADDSFAHGMGRTKAIAYASVKEVIESGVLIDYDENHKQRHYDTALIAAPITIGGERYICQVVIRRNKKNNKFYLHEVIEQKWLSDEGSNTAQKQPQHPKAAAKVLKNIVTSKSFSQIVDKNGEPMVVYHGTPRYSRKRFFAFNTNNGAAWFTNAKGYAEVYAEADPDAISTLYQCFLSIKNPAHVGDIGSKISNDRLTTLAHGLNIPLDEIKECVSQIEDAVHIWNITQSKPFADLLKKHGYDGIQAIEAGVNSYGALEPNQIKSATNNVGTFDDSSDDIRFRIANDNQRIFISNAERAVEQIKQDKATPQQWKAMIEKQGGLKAGEDKWLGLSEWLDSQDKKTITKQEVLDFIAENQIQIEEVAYSAEPKNEVFEQYKQEFRDYYFEAQDNGAEDPQDVAWNRMLEEHGEDFSLGFWAFGSELQVEEDSDYTNWEYENETNERPINETRLDYTTEGLENKREIALTVPTIESWNVNDEVHFGDAGEGRAIAWVRFGETSIPNESNPKTKEYLDAEEERKNFSRKMMAKYGLTYTEGDMSRDELQQDLEITKRISQLKDAQEKIKVLVIDEIQSKRHQEGREKGYKTADDKLDIVDDGKVLIVTYNNRQYFFERGTSRKTIESALGYESLITNKDGVPSAPFEKNWHELAFKRMLRYAAENGFDKVAWTTGAQQAERYDIGSTINVIDVNRDEIDDDIMDVYIYTTKQSRIRLDVSRTTGKVVYVADMYKEFMDKPLSELIGKDLANDIIKSEYEHHRYEGDGLRIGGEGMKGFYDRMLPSFVSKYTKKWGAKVQDINLPDLEQSAQTMHAVNVTESMKEDVMEGQPMFRITEEENRTPLTEAQQLVFDSLVEVAADAGLDVTVGVNQEEAIKKMSSIDTEIVELLWNSPLKVSVVSSEDGAKVLKNIETAKEKYKNEKINSKNIVSTLGKIIGSTKENGSQYARFETVNGQIITIRISDHNANVSNFDNHKEEEGISIVISRKPNNGITNDGTAHVIEFFYSDKKLNQAPGTPIADILQSLEQTLYSGEYKDTTGIAEVEEVNGIELLRNPINGTILGYAQGNRIVLTREGINPETMVHEYTHIWAKAMQRKNPAGWENIKQIFRESPLWDEVVKDPNNEGLETDDAICSEVLARFSGKRGAAQLDEVAREMILEEQQKGSNLGAARVRALINRARTAIKSFWKWVGKNLFGITKFDSQEDVADRVLYDLVYATDLEMLDAVDELIEFAWETPEQAAAMEEWSRNNPTPLLKDYANTQEWVEALHEHNARKTAYAQRLKEERKKEFARMMLEKAIQRAESADPIAEPLAERPKREKDETAYEYAMRLKAYTDSLAETEVSRWYQKTIMMFAWDWWIVRYVNRAKPLWRVFEFAKESGAKITDESYAYDQVFLAKGRIQYAFEKFNRNELANLTEAMRGIIDSKQLDSIELVWQNMDLHDTGYSKNGERVTPRELIGLYAQAKDCEEAEEKGLPNRGKDGFLKNIGISYQELIKLVEGNVDSLLLDNLWKATRACTQFALKYELDSRFISPEKYAENDREYYVPQRGWREQAESSLQFIYSSMSGKTQSPTSAFNAALVKARGRHSLADDPYNYIASIAYSAIMQSENNKIGQSMLKFCLDNLEWGAKHKVFRMRRLVLMNDIDPETGKVRKDKDGIPITTERYSEPSAEDKKHDEAIHNQIKNIKKSLGSHKKALAKELELRGDSSPLVKALQREIAKEEVQIADLQDTLRIATNISNADILQRSSAEKLQHSIFVVEDGKRYEITFEDPMVANVFNKANRVVVKRFLQELTENIGDAIMLNAQLRYERIKKAYDDGRISEDKLKKAEKAYKRTEKFAEKLGPLMSFLGNSTNLYAGALTQYNPVFAGSNVSRDFGFAKDHLRIAHPELVKDFRAAARDKELWRAVWLHAFNDKLKDKTFYTENEYGKLLEEYFESGAQTGYSYLPELREIKRNLDKELKKGKVRESAERTIDAFSLLTEYSENYTRFCAFVAAKKNGWTTTAAASLAKNLTTNFDKRGEVPLPMCYAFLRASVNALSTTWSIFRKAPKRFAYIALAHVAVGMINQLLNPNDPDDEIWASDYIRENNYVIWKLRIPVAHFFRAFHAIGVNMMMAMQGSKTIEKALYGAAMAVFREGLPGPLNITTPLGWSDENNGIELKALNYVQNLAPSVISPITDVMINRNYMGSTINKEPYPGQENTKDIFLAKESTDEIYKRFTQEVYELAGGDMSIKNKLDDDWLADKFDWSASTVEHLTE